MSFLEAYFGILDDATEVPVCCPFPHHTSNGMTYTENRPSAHVNTTDHVFHCKACGTGHSETSFIQAVLGCDLLMAKKLIRCFDNEEDLPLWENTTTLSDAGKAHAERLGISPEVIAELHMKSSEDGRTLHFPVLLYDHLVDIRKYSPGEQPKIRSRLGCPSGLILPYDTWRTSKKSRTTVLCAGEKDMAVARSHGFNAITFTGGEQTEPKFLEEFKDRPVVICYDHDDAGLTGAYKVARKLYTVTQKVKVITKFHEVCTEHGEDITDYFTKYHKTREDLIQCFKETPYYEPRPDELDSAYPIMDLLTASKAENVGKLVRSNIQVVAVSEASYIVPTAVVAEKMRLSGQNDTMLAGATKEFELTDDNVQDILHLMDNNFKEDLINQNLKTLMHIPMKEKFIKLRRYANKTVHKAYITDLFESSAADTIPMEYTAYSLGIKLESGKKYMVTYKIVPHPYKGHQLTMIIVDAKQADDSVTNFALTPEVKEQLRLFQSLPGTVEERINALTQKVKGILGYNGNDTLIQTIDLAYHTVLEFNFGSFKAVRGYLDTFIVGESRVGKSSTANALRSTYELGVFTSLAGNAATIPGLVGGSNKVNGSYQTRAGLIPQNHKGLIIFEEFGKSNSNIAAELTDIRSSNEVRITRVSGTITMPAVVRMITLTNVKTSDGQIKPIASYPNGITVVTELVGTAEDIARYDLLLVLSDRGNSQVDPFWVPEEPMAKEAYQARVRWVWSRTAEQVLISQEVGMYLLAKANELNQQYDTHIKIFGTEAWKKIARLSIATAAYLVSTDDSFENVIVQKEHIDYAVDFFKRIYDNPTFKLKEYVQHERQFSQIDSDGVEMLQDLYMKLPTLVLQLEQCAETSKNMLAAATGLSQDELNKALTMLTRGLFIRFSNHSILPTERFRLGMAQINRNTRALRVGEHNA